MGDGGWHPSPVRTGHTQWYHSPHTVFCSMRSFARVPSANREFANCGSSHSDAGGQRTFQPPTRIFSGAGVEMNGMAFFYPGNVQPWRMHPSQSERFQVRNAGRRSPFAPTLLGTHDERKADGEYVCKCQPWGGGYAGVGQVALASGCWQQIANLCTFRRGLRTAMWATRRADSPVPVGVWDPVVDFCHPSGNGIAGPLDRQCPLQRATQTLYPT